jgi:uncharacterized protein (DUF1697 family)
MLHVALLRGINLAGKNRLAMKDLVAMFEDEGCARVRHYIQSGNIVFDASSAIAKKIPDRITQAIAKHAKIDVPIVIRTKSEMAAVAKDNPFLRTAKDTKALHVGFLAGAPDKKAIASLDPERSPGDTFAVKGREVYLHCPNGIGKSKLTTQWLDAKLRTITTIRNWNTVLKLVAMTEEA